MENRYCLIGHSIEKRYSFKQTYELVFSQNTQLLSQRSSEMTL